MRNHAIAVVTMLAFPFSGSAWAQVGPLAIDVPGSVDGLPVPVSVVPSGTRMGAAGRGWDIPLSYVSESSSLAHRTPTSAAGAVPSAPLRVSLMLLGDAVELIPQGDVWVPQHGSSALSAKKRINPTTQNPEWLVYDGAGLTYTFAHARPDFWILSRIDGQGQGHVDLEYEIALPTVSPWSGAPTYGLTTIDLKKVSYNHSAGGVAKHEVSFVYGASSSTPLSLNIIGGYENGSWKLGRLHTLERIEVKGRAMPGDTAQTLSTYQMNYGTDPDTEQQQLTSVTMKGRQGTAQYDQELLLARYEYGSVTTPGVAGDRDLVYQNTGVLQAPATLPSGTGGWDGFINYVRQDGGPGMSQMQTLTDMTGDGRADVVWSSAATGDAQIARNRPDTSGKPLLTDANLTGTLNDAVMQSPYFGYSLSWKGGPTHPSDENQGQRSYSQVFSQLLDVNADGRPDVISAIHDKWVVFLNTPAPNFPYNTKWIRYDYDVSHLVTALSDHRISSPAQGDDDILPLSQTVTVENAQSGGASSGGVASGHTVSAVAWQLGDFNGDGRLDLLMETQAPFAHHDGGNPGRWYLPEGSLTVIFGTASSLIPNSRPVEMGGCGIQRVLSYDVTHALPAPSDQFVICDLRDINGDGLLDSLDYQAAGHWDLKGALYGQAIIPPVDVVLGSQPVAYLGDGAGLDTKPAMALPGDQSSLGAGCLPNGGTPPPSQKVDVISAYLDVTGDGILDFVTRGQPNGLVRIGTGVGFRSAVGGPANVSSSESGCTQAFTFDSPIPLMPGRKSEYSRTLVGYVNGFSKLRAAYIDVDGDGRPEAIESPADVHSQWGWTRRELVGMRGGIAEPRALSAGRVIAIDNGHGARTEISYASAKDDNSTPHQVPSPEIVVSSVKTTQASTQQFSETQYAYGNPIFGYDSFAERFRSFGYGRTVALTRVGAGRSPESIEGVASVTDTYPLADQIASGDWKGLFDRYLRAGRPKDVTTLSGTLSSDPRSILTLDLAASGRRIGATHYDYDSKVWPNTTDEAGCKDWLEPYLGGPTGLNTCKSRGFIYTSGTWSWNGSSGPPSTDNVMTDSHVIAMDDFGRVTAAYQGNDSRRTDDNLCVTTSYAVPPVNEFPRMLSAIAESQVVKANSDGICTGTVLDSQRMQYDDLPQGQVGDGLLTSQIVDRRKVEDGELIKSILSFNAEYYAGGKLHSMTTTADDRQRTVSVTYDGAFGLVPVTRRIEAAGLPALESSMRIDAHTLATLGVTDPNGVEQGVVYDGFGRSTQSTVTPIGGTRGVMSETKYFNFESADPTVQRSVVTRTFDNPVAPAQVSIAVGHTATTRLDDFGRAIRTEVDLGSDYGDDMIVGDVRFDAFGRVAFAADPYPTSQNGATAYGTTHFFNTDGTPKCSIRGHGPQTLPGGIFGSTDETTERYPTCYSREFRNGREVVGNWDADALLSGSPQEGVQHLAEFDAVGRLFARSTWSPTQRLELSEFQHDALGNVERMTRFKSPGSQSGLPSDPVTWRFAYDSLGQLLRQDEPNVGQGVVSRFSDYSNWGEVIATHATANSGTPLPDQWEIMEYDALSRLIRSTQRRDGGPLPETVYDYTYDIGTAVHAAMPTYPMLGQLATATSPTSRVYFAYDDYGRLAAQATQAPDQKLYVETLKYDGDGMVTDVGNWLPDTSGTQERVNYSYDSARRLNTSKFYDAAGGRPLFKVDGIDAFGRVRAATIGDDALYEANYADVGRRLLQSMTLQSHSGAQREMTITGYDPVGRERSRKERDDLVTETTTHTYDALGRLVGSARGNTTQMLSQRAFSYDALGNLLEHADLLGTDDVSVSYRDDNRDRVCSIGYGAAPPATCNVVHDALGQILEQPAAGGTRSYGYLPSGAVSSITTPNGAQAAFRYDAFGAVQELDISGAGSDNRKDRRYGSVEIRAAVDGGSSIALITRNFSVGGMKASRKGPQDKWVFALGEARGNRFFVDEKGEFVQDVDYEAFGETRSQGASWDSPMYTREQWNGGDSLAAFGIHHLGARLYDPKIGRFLSVDPLLLMRTATTSNPYAFADNDPVNSSDPSGLQPETVGHDVVEVQGTVGHEIIEVQGKLPPPLVNSFNHFWLGLGFSGEYVRTLWERQSGASPPNFNTNLVAAASFRQNWVSPGQGLTPKPFAMSGLASYGGAKGMIIVARQVAAILPMADRVFDVMDKKLDDALQGKSTALDIDDLAPPTRRLGTAPPAGTASEKIGSVTPLPGKQVNISRRSSDTWSSPDRAGGQYDCAAAVCARIVRGAGVVNADNVLHKAHLTQKLINENGGMGEGTMRRMFEKNGLKIASGTTGVKDLTTGDYLVWVRGNKLRPGHAMYGRMTRSGKFYVEDPQARRRYTDNASGAIVRSDNVEIYRVTPVE